jgi:hypothetical protein
MDLPLFLTSNFQSQIAGNGENRNILLEHILDQLAEMQCINSHVLEWLLALLQGLLSGSVVETSVQARSNTLTIAVIDNDNRKVSVSLYHLSFRS